MQKNTVSKHLTKSNHKPGGLRINHQWKLLHSNISIITTWLEM